MAPSVKNVIPWLIASLCTIIVIGGFLGQSQSEAQSNLMQVSAVHRSDPVRLRLTSMCSPDPSTVRVWRVRNQNAFDMTYTWQVYGNAQSGEGTAIANSDVFFQTATVPNSPNTTIIRVNGEQQDVKASNPAACNPTAVPSATTAPTLTPIPSPTPTATNTPSTTPTSTFTLTPSPSATFTPSATPTSTFTHTPSPTATFTPSPTPTTTNTPSATPTSTFTHTPSPTTTFTPSAMPTSTFTLTPSPTASATPTNTFTLTPSPTTTFTPSATPTSTFTLTPSPTATFTPSPTNTPISPECEFNIPAGDVSLLIQTINIANANGVADIICLTPGSTYQLNSANNSGFGLPAITSTIQIKGFGSTISGTASTMNRTYQTNNHLYITIEMMKSNTGFSLIGAINGGNLTLNDITLMRGNGIDGGALHITGATVTLTNVDIINNSGGNGGGIFNNSGSVIINGGRIASNTAMTTGGGIYNGAGNINVNGTRITGNSAQSGGGINNEAGATMSIINSAITDNNTGGFGGGIATSDPRLTVNDSCLFNNSGTFGSSVSNTDFFGTAIVDATHNWWGSATGPGTGMTGGNVNTTSFRTTPLAICS